MKLFIISLTLSALCYAATYGMADLQKLEAERAFREFFQHAHDVLPSARTAEWNGLVETMGEAYLRQLKAQNRLQRQEFEQMEKLMGWPVLARHEFFRQLRGDVGLRWFGQCFQADSSPISECWNDLLGYWEKGRQDPDLAPRLYTTLAPYLTAQSPTNASFILAPMLKSAVAGLQCQKPAIASLVWEAAKEFSESEFAQKQAELAHASCWQALLPLARVRLAQGGQRADVDLARRLLKVSSTLKVEDEDVYLVAYLLDRPQQGDDFNLAWNRLVELGNSSPRRERVNRSLKSWRPLPGEIFANTDAQKKATVAKHFQRHFPEYLDYYALTCVDFYGARKRFPEGNPAHHCRELFQLSAELPGLLPESTRQSFEKALK